MRRLVIQELGSRMKNGLLRVSPGEAHAYEPATAVL
jgi:hypothetical protein